MHRGFCAFLAATAVLLPPAIAVAQDSPPFDPAIDVQLFEYAIGPKTFFAIDDGEIAGKSQLTLDLFITFLTDPFTVYNVDPDDDVIEGTRTRVVREMLAGELSGAYGLGRRLQLGLSLPVIFSMQGDGLMPETGGADPDGMKVSGTGDLRVEMKAQLWQNAGLRLAGAFGASFPTSFDNGDSEFIGDDLPALRGRAIGQWTGANGRVSLGANLGLSVRKPRTIYASTVGQQLHWGVAGAVRFTDRFSVVAETFGRTGLEGLDLDASPVEAEGGMRVLVTKAVAVVAGAGAGIVKGIGSPDVRFFASIGYAPDTRDTDGDGVANNRDRCPSAAEDRDGFEDSDGCPDDDNDGDRRDDANDKCPAQGEDFDGFQDDDGCPESDNDTDGIVDPDDTCPEEPEDKKDPFPADGCPWDSRDTDGDRVKDHLDQCPRDPEDLDGFEDWDGCLDEDQDKDQIADEDDRCPLCAEDRDGFADTDGCPELDNDADGIADASDRCTSELETINGVDDLDGCPDSGGALIVELDGDKLGFRSQPTFDQRGLNKGGLIIVDQAALTMLRHPEVTRWLIAIAGKTKTAADQQGKWLVARLSERGISSNQIEVLTSTGTPQIGIVVRERVDEVPVGVCPAGTAVVPRPAPTVTPKPAPVPTRASTGAAPMPPAVAKPPAPPIASKPAVASPAAPAVDPAPVSRPGHTEPATSDVPLPPAIQAMEGPTSRLAFSGSQAKLAGNSAKFLGRLASILKSNPGVILTVHVRGKGGQEQADLARAFLLGKGVVADQVEASAEAADLRSNVVELRFRGRP